jgi:hypothetical protein
MLGQVMKMLVEAPVAVAPQHRNLFREHPTKKGRLLWSRPSLAIGKDLEVDPCPDAEVAANDIGLPPGRVVVKD